MKEAVKLDLNSHLQRKLATHNEKISDILEGRPSFPPPKPLAYPSSDAYQKDSSVYVHAHHGEDLVEYADDQAELQHKVEVLAKLMKESKRCIIYTGAGISTSAKLPDYRSTTGIWTKKQQGEDVEFPLNALQDAQPTIAHNAIKTLIGDLPCCDLVVSTNIDGLHSKSGLTDEQLIELHGNLFKEHCPDCGKNFLREFVVVQNAGAMGDHGKDHRTGRTCEECGGEL
eukprot:CAMPEP_0174273802 /NCGR_PEP_ID=MMETSP0439-20130205/55845_1 /TAXON_ID=0 /ORGANISM="Stereomyxa ramosa, Strain Chinc5" /LENGTH=227 /DNA_ID=CAMNT_0015365207 /DNA_START=39 /DNA_END=719 /DNA_ORIENTATION=-